MLPPPQPARAGSLETGSVIRQTGGSHTIAAPEGTYAIHDNVLVMMPIPHPSESAPGAINPLAADRSHPSTMTMGVKMAAMALATNYAVSSGPQKHKPKLSVQRNKTSMMSMAIVYEGFARRVLEQQSELVTWVNVGRSLVLLDADPDSQHRAQALAKFLFNVWPLCLAANPHSAAANQLDLAVGLSSGEILWLEISTHRYSYMNKSGALLHSSPVTALEWLPGTDTILVAGFANGSIAILDIERDDGAPVASRPSDPNLSTPIFRVLQSGTAQTKSNPVAYYQLSDTAITAIQFSGLTMAVGCRDGYVRLMDLERQGISDILPTYFGAATTLAFSPDAQYLAVGGEDDAVVMYEVATLKVTARLKGHSGFVTKVAFDPFAKEINGYRLGSVGEDGRIILWDFAPELLPASKAHDEPTYVGKSQLHQFIANSGVPIVFPSAQASPVVENNTPAPLCDLLFAEHTVMATSSDGYVYTWVRP